MKLIAVLEKADGWVTIYFPTLPGCVSQGRTEEEAIENIKDAAMGWLDAEAETVTTRNPRILEVEI